jgi:hypothetical protein
MKGINHRLLSHKFIVTVILFIATNPGLYAQEEKQLVIGQQPVYKVARARETIKVDGKMDEAAWKNAQVVSFDNFFRNDKPVDKQKSKFRMLWDSTSIYPFLRM